MGEILGKGKEEGNLVKVKERHRRNKKIQSTRMTKEMDSRLTVGKRDG